MIKVVSSDEMRLLDKMAIEGLGIPGMVLMENAGRAVYERIVKLLKENRSSYIILLAGKGNNGGDAFVTGRHLYNRGYNVSIFFTGKREILKGDCLENFLIAEKTGITLKEITEEKDFSSLIDEIKVADLLVDGLLGTGIKGSPRGITAKIIDIVNKSQKPVIAIDTPSGLDCTTGQVKGPCIKALETVTFGLPKIGMFIYPGASYTGRLVIADISIPGNLWKYNEKFFISLITPDIIKDYLPERKADFHKGKCGRVLVVAGSPGYTGAASLSSLASLKAGAGLVTLIVPESLNSIFEVKLTEVMTKPAAETDKGTLSLKAFDEIEKFPASAMAVGPGISLNDETALLVRKLIASSKVPLVIDADGLSAVAEDKDVLFRASSPLILTPHPGEMSRLTSFSIEDIMAEPVKVAREFAVNFKVFLILKLANSIIATPEGKVYINPTGNSGMASGGTGDVLTGIVTSLLAQGVPPLYSCLIGAFIHGLSGDLALLGVEEEAMIAGDLITCLSQAYKKLKQASSGESLVNWIVEV